MCVRNCTLYDLLPVGNECLTRCPYGYTHRYDVRKEEDMKHCYKCNGTCDYVCPGQIIDSKRDLFRYQFCNVIVGDMLFNLDGSNFETKEYLYNAFKYIRVIYGALRVIR